MVETLRTLERALSAEINDDFSSITTTVGDAGGTDVNDAALAEREPSGGTDSLKNMYFDMIAGEDEGEVRRISANTVAQITVARALSDPVAAGMHYAAHKWHPDSKVKAINSAPCRSIHSISTLLILLSLQKSSNLIPSTIISLWGFSLFLSGSSSFLFEKSTLNKDDDPILSYFVKSNG